MNITSRTHPSGQIIYTVESGDSTFELTDFGGQLLSWTKANVPIIFANRDHAVMDGHTAYRGGAPICFPLFGKGTLLPNAPTLAPQHGHARTSIWSAEMAANSIQFQTLQSTAPEVGATELNCQVTYHFDTDLRVEVDVTNRGGAAAPFQWVLHTYWATEDPATAAIEGLAASYLDNLQNYAETQDPAPDAPHQPPFDRVYPDSNPHLQLRTKEYEVAIETKSCAGSVLWNPGPHHPIADLGTPNFICLESGLITPARTLNPGESWSATISYAVQVPG